MSVLPKSVQITIKELSKLPGVGNKTATRLAFYLLNRGQTELNQLARAVKELKQDLTICETCCNIAERNPCSICSSANRDHTKVLVVEDPLDVIAFENTHQFDGVYHVLHGVLSPIESIGPEQLRISELLQRLDLIDQGEVILATNPSLEGEATADFIKQHIKNQSLTITRIAKGMPVGGELEYADLVTLTQSLNGRRDY